MSSVLYNIYTSGSHHRCIIQYLILVYWKPVLRTDVCAMVCKLIDGVYTPDLKRNRVEFFSLKDLCGCMSSQCIITIILQITKSMLECMCTHTHAHHAHAYTHTHTHAHAHHLAFFNTTGNKISSENTLTIKLKFIWKVGCS